MVKRKQPGTGQLGCYYNRGNSPPSPNDTTTIIINKCMPIGRWPLWDVSPSTVPRNVEVARGIILQYCTFHDDDNNNNILSYV